MGQYIVRRLMLAIPTLVLVSVIIFVTMRILPGDPAFFVLGGTEGAAHSEEELAKVRRELGLDKPIYLQYINWAWDALRFDFGNSLHTRRPVTDLITAKLPVTAQLAVVAVAVALVVSIPLGILSAIRQDTPVDYVIRVFLIMGMTLPAFFTASLLLIGGVYLMNWMPPIGWVPFRRDPLGNVQTMLIPVCAMAYLYAGILGRMTRSQMLEVLRLDYMRTARAKGLRETTVIIRHGLKNALIPLVTIAGVQLAQIITGIVVIEFLFALPGLGSALIAAVQERDLPVVQGIVLLIAAVYLLMNLIVDVLYAYLDPRVRYN